MGDVVDFDDAKRSKEPHLSAPVRCMNCGYSWVAVAPVGTVVFDCPHCELEKGVAETFVYAEGEHAVCRCGCDLFRIGREFVYCIHCGQRIGATTGAYD